MKRIVTLMVVVLAAAPLALPQSATLPVKASFPMVLDLSHWIRWAEADYDPYDAGHSGDVINDILDFGTLSLHDDYKIFMSNKYFTVFLVAETSGAPYIISQSSSGFTKVGDATKNINSAVVMTPDYQAADRWDRSDPSTAQGAKPAGHYVASPALALGTHEIYKVTDEAAGTVVKKIVRCYYGIFTDDPGLAKPAGAKVLDTDTAGGQYEGTITFTVVYNW